MLRRIFTVGGYTLLSRLTGFARDIMLAAILGAGPVADAFFVALRLPNHFRAIFAEGAFNAAFVPAYAHVHGQSETLAKIFANRIFTLLFGAQVDAAGGGWLFMPQVIGCLRRDSADDPARGELAIELTRITFPYLLLITLVTLYGGMLNVMHRFASAAAAPIFLNLSMMATLALAAFFPGAGYAAAWGVLIAGILEFLLLAADAWRERHPAAVRMAETGRGRPRLLPRAWPCDHRLDGHAGRAVCRHHHRDVPRRRRAVGAVLRRPSQPVADRRDRDRDRHRAVAGNVAAAHGGRLRRRRGLAAAGVRFHAAAVGAVRRRFPGGP